MKKIIDLFISFLLIPGLLGIAINMPIALCLSILSQLDIVPKYIYDDGVNVVGWITFPICIFFGIKFYYDLTKSERTNKLWKESNDLENYQRNIKNRTYEIELDENNEVAYFSRGFSKFKLQDYQGAKSDYTKTLELNPNDVDVYFNRGLIKQLLQDYEGSKTDYTKVIDLNPNHINARYSRTNHLNAYFNRGKVKSILQDHQGAISDYTKAIELDKHWESAYKNRGIAKYHLRDYKGSIMDYLRAKDPNHATIKFEQEQAAKGIYGKIGYFKT